MYKTIRVSTLVGRIDDLFYVTDHVNPFEGTLSTALPKGAYCIRKREKLVSNASSSCRCEAQRIWLA